MSWKPSTESGNHKHHKKPETTFDSHSGNLKLPHKTVVKDTKPNNSIKKNIILIGDSMLNGLHEKGFKNHKVTIKAHSGATTDDIYHHIKPEINKKPDVIIIHSGTNDLPSDMKSIDNLKKIHDYLNAHSPTTKLVISAITTRKDLPGMENKVKLMNDRIKKFATNNTIALINHNNIDDSCLSTKKLHLNKKGNSYLANNFIKYLD